MTHVYMVAHFKDGGHYIDVMSKAEVDDIRRRSKTPNNGPWVTDYEAMARKTVIRRAFPYLPVSVQTEQDVAADDTTPTVYDDEGIQLFPDSVEVPDNVDAETGEIIEPEVVETAAAPAPVREG